LAPLAENATMRAIVVLAAALADARWWRPNR
jgi:hypothetical protein